MTKLSYLGWCEKFLDDVFIEFAETGADRELDFNPERELERRYDKYFNAGDDTMDKGTIL